MTRLAAYAGASLALSAAVTLKALHQRANFYSACVYLSQSNANLMILTNLCLLIVGFVLFGLQRLLYGRLRPIETEQLYEKAWFAVTETCLAMTIFRGELGAWFIVMFVCLLVGKVWGWIGEGRVEILEQQTPNNPRLFHTRLAVSLLLAVSFNTFMLEYAVKTVLRQARPDMMVMFGFEFAVLTILSTSTTARYALSLAEIYIVRQQKKARLAERRDEIRASREEIIRTCLSTGADPPRDLPNEDDIDEIELDVPGWEEKGRWVFYLDLITDFFKLVVYLSFFAILFTFYGLPIHILRDVVLTMRSFAKRILDFIRYRNATRDMNSRYPDATAEEIAREDVCIICREEMQPWQPPEATPARVPEGRTGGRVSERLRPKKLPCGHLLHFACLRSWLERQQNCPTCRRPVTTVGRGRAQEEGNAPARANQPPGGNAQAAGGRPRAWVLNLGPLRVGFGAGRGDQLQDIAHQLNAGQVPADRANPNRPTANQQPTDLGLSSARSAPMEMPTNMERISIQNQILHLEQQINQEISSLLAASDQLQVVRLLQNELARLRAVNSNRSLTGNDPNMNPQVLSSVNPLAFHNQSIPTSQSAALASGGHALPEGISLPPGWTLIPLQDSQPENRYITSPFSNFSLSPNNHTSSPQNPSRSQLFADSPQVISKPVASSSTPPSAAMISRQESCANPDGRVAGNRTPPQRPISQNRSASPSLDWTEVTSDRISDGATLPDIQSTIPRDSPVESRSEGGSSLAPYPDNDRDRKGKARVATVEDAEE